VIDCKKEKKRRKGKRIEPKKQKIKKGQKGRWRMREAPFVF